MIWPAAPLVCHDVPADTHGIATPPFGRMICPVENPRRVHLSRWEGNANLLRLIGIGAHDKRIGYLLDLVFMRH